MINSDDQLLAITGSVARQCTKEPIAKSTTDSTALVVVLDTDSGIGSTIINPFLLITIYLTDSIYVYQLQSPFKDDDNSDLPDLIPWSAGEYDDLPDLIPY